MKMIHLVSTEIRTHDLFGHESPPLTSLPGLQPMEHFLPDKSHFKK